MAKASWTKGFIGSGVVGALLLTLGCSGSTEDVRITFCKDLAVGLTGSESIEWTGGENRFNRPAYAITALTFSAVAPPIAAYRLPNNTPPVSPASPTPA